MPQLAPLTAWFALLLALVGAPLIPGISQKTRAMLTGRRGAPLWQLYADLWKLCRRGMVYSTTTTWIFRLAPLAVLSTTLSAAALVPFDGRSAVLRFAGDAVAFACLLALGRFVLVLAALDTGSSFEGMGASREVAFASLVEPGIFVAFTSIGIMAHDFSLSVMLGAKAASTTGAATAPTAIMVALSLFALALAECARVPVDDPATHLELTMIHEVMVLDHSGPDFALILYANALKLGLFASIIGSLLAQRSGTATGLLMLGVSFVALGMAIGMVEASMARLRLPKVPLFIAGGSALALFGLILSFR
jgi:formate hydrogenlyase subunit 4